MDYNTFKEKLKENDGEIRVYVPDKADSMTALQGALFEKAIQKEGLEMYDINFVTYHEPNMRVGETEQEYSERLLEYYNKMQDIENEHIVLGSSRSNITITDLRNISDPWQSLNMELIETVLSQDTGRMTEDKLPLSQMIDAANLTRQEVMGAKSDFNFWNASNLMAESLDARDDAVKAGLLDPGHWGHTESGNYLDRNFEVFELQTSIEEDIYKTRYSIPFELTRDGELNIIAVPQEVAGLHFSGHDYGSTADGNIIIAMITDQELKDIDLYDKLEPVIEMGGQDIYNAEGDNITMNIRQITDAWAKSQIHDAIQDAKSFTRGNITFRVANLDQAGAFYEDIAKSAQGTDIAGYTYEQRGRVIFKPIEQKEFNLQIPDEWKEGRFPDEVEQVNKNGLSVSFKSQEDFVQGIDIMLDEMGIEKDVELEVDKFEDIEQESPDIEPEPDMDEEELELN